MKSTEHVTALAARLFAARGRDLLRYLRQRVRVDADARDLAQETYLRFIRLAKPDRIENPEAYLYRIASNLLWEHQLRERGQAGRAQIAESPVDEYTPFDSSVSDDLIREVRGVLGELAPMPKTILILHMRDGLTYAEIGRHVGLSIAMIKRHLGTALAHCRTRLRPPER